MKKITTFLLVTAMAATLSACATREQQEQEGPVPEAPSASESGDSLPPPDPSTPDGAVVELFDGARRWDTAIIDDCLPGDATLEQYVPAALQGTAAKVLGRMSYDIGSVTIEGDVATVELEITSVDAESAVNEAVGAAIVYIGKKQITGGSIDSYTEIAQAITESIDIDKLATQTTATKAHLTRQEGGDWELDLTDENNTALLNAVSGGTVEIIDRVKELMDTYGISFQNQ